MEGHHPDLFTLPERKLEGMHRERPGLGWGCMVREGEVKKRAAVRVTVIRWVLLASSRLLRESESRRTAMHLLRSPF